MKSYKDIHDFINESGCEWIEALIEPSEANSNKRKVWIKINRRHPLTLGVDFFKNEDIEDKDFIKDDLDQLLRKIHDCVSKRSFPIKLEQFETFKDKIIAFYYED
ncbi:MAG: hypothetical protein FWG13_07825 [Leptospirales bacterium]|nr:hypothetical protein [Leptospirales bacterium]